jgi:hypothetical protein
MRKHRRGAGEVLLEEVFQVWMLVHLYEHFEANQKGFLALVASKRLGAGLVSASGIKKKLLLFL